MPAWSGFFDNVHPGGHALIQTFTGPERAVNRLLNKGNPGRSLRNTIVALTGSAVGQSKALTQTQIAHSTAQFGLGGKRTTEVRTVQAGVTTAGDLTRVDDRLTRTKKPTTYPVDKSGNGGGGKSDRAF